MLPIRNHQKFLRISPHFKAVQLQNELDSHDSMPHLGDGDCLHLASCLIHIRLPALDLLSLVAPKPGLDALELKVRHFHLGLSQLLCHDQAHLHIPNSLKKSMKCAGDPLSQLSHCPLTLPLSTYGAW